MTEVGRISKLSPRSKVLRKVLVSLNCDCENAAYFTYVVDTLDAVIMDAQDFAIPSPKRQRTESPKPAPETVPPIATSEQQAQLEAVDSQETETKPQDDTPETACLIPGLGLTLAQPEPELVEAQPPAPEGNNFLDALMQHVESMHPDAERAEPPTVVEEALAAISRAREHVHSIGGNTLETMDTPAVYPSMPALQGPEVTERRVGEEPTVFPPAQSASKDPTPSSRSAMLTMEAAVEPVAAHDEVIGEARQEPEATVGVNGISTAQDEAMAETRQETETMNPPDSIPTTQDETMGDAQPADSTNPPAEGAEWEVDSSPYVSSDSDDSSDTTSDNSDDEDADGDYAMLDPEEQARILMAGDGGSDDEGDKKGKSDGGHLRTANEKVEEIIPKPDIVVTPEMPILELGIVEGVIERTVLVRATVPSEYQVVESNSLLCLADRSVVGVVAEPLGRVEQPMYTIRFTNDDEIKEAGLFERGTKVYYVPAHSTFVFTQPLKAVKGSDASNFHDEEVGDEEMEFSDDEAEAEHKRQLKMKRQGRRDDGGGRGRGRGGRGNYQRGGRQEYRAPSSDAGSVYGGASVISYDDVPAGADEGYTPLTRPPNLNEMMAGVQREPLEGSHHTNNYSERGEGRGRGRGRGRGGRSRGGRSGGGNQPSWTSHQAQSNGYAQYSPQSQSQSMLPPPSFPYQYQQQPHQPRILPQNQQTPFSPSPISPLPLSGQFNYNFQQQGQGQQWPYQQQQQQQQQYGQTSQGEQQRNPLYDGQPQLQQFNMGTWGPNLTAAAQVTAQLEQLRRSQGHGQ